MLAFFDFLRGSLVPWEPTSAVTSLRLFARYRTLVIDRTWVCATAVVGLMYDRLPLVGWVNLLPTALLLAIEVALSCSVLGYGRSGWVIQARRVWRRGATVSRGID